MSGTVSKKREGKLIWCSFSEYQTGGNFSSSFTVQGIVIKYNEESLRTSCGTELEGNMCSVLQAL